jgi:hypothetical protein
MIIENNKIRYLRGQNADKGGIGGKVFPRMGSQKASKATHLLTHFHISCARLQRNRQVQYACNQQFIDKAGMAKLADAADLKPSASAKQWSQKLESSRELS